MAGFSKAKTSIDGQTSSGASKSVSTNAEGSLKVAIDDPHTAFGEVLVGSLNPISNIAAYYGIRIGQVELFSSSVAYSTCSIIDDNFVVGTQNEIGGYGVIRSRRPTKYRAGMGNRFRITAGWPSGSYNNALLFAGAFNIYDMIGFGYNGTTFGIHHRVSGSTQIMKLTNIAGATTIQTASITLNDVTFQIPLTSGTVAHNCYEIASGSQFTSGPFVSWRVDQIDNEVFFQSEQVGIKAGSYHVTSTGNFTGNLVTLREGAANDINTNFIPQASWNVDIMDGSGASNNPSGLTLNPSKVNVFDISMKYLGYGTIDFYIEEPSAGKFTHVHRIKWSNENLVPHLKIPILKPGWIAASLGSTDSICTIGSSAAGFVEGNYFYNINPRGHTVSKTGIGTSETLIVSYKNSNIFNNQVNLNELIPVRLTVASAASAGKPNTIVNIYLLADGAKIIGETNYKKAGGSDSYTIYNTSGSIISSDITGSLIASAVLGPDGAEAIDIERMNVKMSPNDRLVITAQATSNTVDISTALTWLEE